MSNTSAVSSRGVTTIPRRIREALGFQPGDKLAWHLGRDGIILCQHKPADPQRQTLDTVGAVLRRQ